MAVMPVAMGWVTDLRAMMPGEFLDRVIGVGLDLALAVDGDAEGIDHAAEERLADGDLEQLAGGADLVALLDALELAEDDGANLGFLEVEGEADDAAGELEHLVERGAGKAFDLGHAVGDFAHGADVGLGDVGFEGDDLGFDFFEEGAHRGEVEVRRKKGEGKGGELSMEMERREGVGRPSSYFFTATFRPSACSRRSRRLLREPSQIVLPRWMRRPPRRSGLTS
jgi:hypothetical protein